MLMMWASWAVFVLGESRERGLQAEMGGEAWALGSWSCEVCEMAWVGRLVNRFLSAEEQKPQRSR